VRERGREGHSDGRKRRDVGLVIKQRRKNERRKEERKREEKKEKEIRKERRKEEKGEGTAGHGRQPKPKQFCGVQV